MAQTVVMRTECLHIKRGGIELHINKGKERLGRLLVSNGKIEWLPVNKQNGIALTWKKFDKLMQEIKTK